MGFYRAFYAEENVDVLDTNILAIYQNIGLILKTEAAYLFEGPARLSHQSHLCFGIEDIALFSRVNSGEQIALRVKNKLVQFEPRLANIAVQYIDNESSHKLTNTLRFLISATREVNGKNEKLMLDTDIDLTEMKVLIENDSQYDE
ncbi:GPW/gp25 family protein [Thalassotalea montiporae]